MGFRQLPHPLGRGGFVSFLHVSLLMYWYIGCGGGVFEKTEAQTREKRPKTRIIWRALKFLESVCFLGIPRQLGRGGFVSFVNISITGYW